jgi:hypothetical protein
VQRVTERERYCLVQRLGSNGRGSSRDGAEPRKPREHVPQIGVCVDAVATGDETEMNGSGLGILFAAAKSRVGIAAGPQPQNGTLLIQLGGRPVLT